MRSYDEVALDSVLRSESSLRAAFYRDLGCKAGRWPSGGIPIERLKITDRCIKDIQAQLAHVDWTERYAVNLAEKLATLALQFYAEVASLALFGPKTPKTQPIKSEKNIL